VEIKCQLDATEVFIADLIACSTCFGHHYAHHQELKSIIQWLLPVVFRSVVFKLLVWCGAEGYVSGLQDAAIASAFIKSHPTNGIPDPQTETNKLPPCMKPTKDTHTRPTRHSTHIITKLDTTRYLILRTQILPNLQITFYIFTAPNNTGSNHSIILLSS